MRGVFPPDTETYETIDEKDWIFNPLCPVCLLNQTEEGTICAQCDSAFGDAPLDK